MDENTLYVKGNAFVSFEFPISDYTIPYGANGEEILRSVCSDLRDWMSESMTFNDGATTQLRFQLYEDKEGTKELANSTINKEQITDHGIEWSHIYDAKTSIVRDRSILFKLGSKKISIELTNYKNLESFKHIKLADVVDYQVIDKSTRDDKIFVLRYYDEEGEIRHKREPYKSLKIYAW